MMNFTVCTEFSEDLRADWNVLLTESVTHVPFLRFEYLASWWQTRGGGEWPQAELAIITAYDGERLAGIAPLFQAQSAQGQPALYLLGSIEISDYLDIIVRPADLDAFVSGLLAFLPQSGLAGWRTLDLYNLLDSSATLGALERTAQAAGWQINQAQLQHSPHVPLPGDWEAYLANIDKKQRHEIRRKMRRFESAEVPTRWYIVSEGGQLAAEMDAFIALMDQDEEKAAFLTETMRAALHGVARVAFEQGFLQLAFLEVDGKKAAAYFSFDYLNKIWVYNSGFDRDSLEYSPGWVLLGYLLQWANEHGRQEFDFMRGDEEYKYRFGAVDRFVMRATLQA